MAVDSHTAKRMQLWGRWGSSCGMGFYKDAFCDRHPIWDNLRPYLHDRPPQPWTLFGVRHKGQNVHKVHKAQTHRHKKDHHKGQTHRHKGHRHKKDHHKGQTHRYNINHME